MSENKIQEEVYRFLQDLEFLQCLANPSYLECNFLNYILIYFTLKSPCIKWIFQRTIFHKLSILSTILQKTRIHKIFDVRIKNHINYK